MIIYVKRWRAGRRERNKIYIGEGNIVVCSGKGVEGTIKDPRAKNKLWQTDINGKAKEHIHILNMFFLSHFE